MIFRSRYSIGKLNKTSKQSVGARFQHRKQKFNRLKHFFKNVFLFFFGLGLLGSLIVGFVVWNISKTLPDVEAISTYIPSETTKIYSDDGVVLAELHKEENRVLIPIEQISPILKETIVAIEDSRFYKHKGFDFLRLTNYISLLHTPDF